MSISRYLRRQRMSRDDLLEQRLQDLEAALYSAGRPLTIDDIKPVLRTRSDNVSLKVVKTLSSRYSHRDRALEVILFDDGRVAMQLKPDYDDFVRQFNNKPLLKLGPLKTLSYVAFHQPVDQRQVISDRGSHVYSHLRMMVNMGLIHRERTEDRSYIITTTSFYGDYFGFSHNPERSRLQLKQVFKELKITKLENGAIENLYDGVIDGLEELDELEEELLADSGNGLTHGLSQYAGSSNNSSK
jgi:segregation and condensation protein B